MKRQREREREREREMFTVLSYSILMLQYVREWELLLNIFTHLYDVWMRETGK